MTRIGAACIAAIVLALATPAARAATIPEPGLDYFERGVTQYRVGNYASALFLFEMARAAGNRNPNLSYDIALTLYRLGRDAEARRAFENLYFEPGYESIAEYHLGLIAARTGDREAATASLRRAADGAQQEPLRQLAGLALAQMQGLRPRGTWAAYGALGGGFDTNAGYQSDDLQETSESSDSFYEGIGVVDYPLEHDRYLTGSLYAREYADYPDYSQQTAQLALRQQAAGLSWQASATGRVEASYFGGQSLHNAATLALDGRHALGPGYVVLRGATTRFSSGDLFPELEGWRHRVGVEYAAHRGAVGYELELNDRADLAEEGGAFASRSPTRHTLAARTSRPLGAGFTLEWRSRFRYSHYEDPDRFGGVEQRRKDTLAETGLGGRWRLSKLWSVLAEARYARNSSSFDHYEYKRGSGLLSVEVTL